MQSSEINRAKLWQYVHQSMKRAINILIDLFGSKRFRNFVRSKSVWSVFRDCAFEVTRANLIQIFFLLFKFCQRSLLTSELNLLWSRMNAKDFRWSVGKSFIASQEFLLENCLLHSSAKHAITVRITQLLQKEMVFIKGRIWIVIFSNRIVHSSTEFSYQKTKCWLAITSRFRYFTFI